MADTALIGHTGFVGSNLLQQRHFSATFNSSTITDIRHRDFDDVVCAGVSAVKWWANQNEELDRNNIKNLMNHLETISARNFTLISTIDVYKNPNAVTEKSPTETDGLHAYGKNRVMLERFIVERFPACQIIRLPALFGTGLKKNAIYDLMHDNRISVINPDSSFQWYPLDRLASDLEVARIHSLPILNLATEPVTMEEIRGRFFAAHQIGADPAPQAHYNMHTLYDRLFNGANGYIVDKAYILDAIGRFIASETQARATQQR